MFTIYNDGVRSFAGTLERLYEVHPIERVARADRESLVPNRAREDEREGAARDAFGLTSAAISTYRKAAKLYEGEPILHAHQIMRTSVVSVRADTDIRDAWLLLRQHRIRQMPVQTAKIELVGLLSERDVLEQLIIERDQIRYGEARTVADVMDHEVITADPVTDVRRIARVMADGQLTALPIVTAQDELVGIVSRGDLLRAMTRNPPLRLWA